MKCVDMCLGFICKIGLEMWSKGIILVAGWELGWKNGISLEDIAVIKGNCYFELNRMIDIKSIFFTHNELPGTDLSAGSSTPPPRHLPASAHQPASLHDGVHDRGDRVGQNIS